MKIYQVVISAVIAADKDPVQTANDPKEHELTEHALFEEMLVSDSFEMRAVVIGETASINDLLSNARNARREREGSDV